MCHIVACGSYIFGPQTKFILLELCAPELTLFLYRMRIHVRYFHNTFAHLTTEKAGGDKSLCAGSKFVSIILKNEAFQIKTEEKTYKQTFVKPINS
jgi:hypothetical protein